MEYKYKVLSFLDNLDRIGADGYVPTEQDILRSRLATSGIHEYNFTFQEVNFKIIDVGGQRYERSKWATAFDNVTSLIFIASLSEYDQRLMESNSVVSLFELEFSVSNCLYYRIDLKSRKLCSIKSLDVLGLQDPRSFYF